MMISVDFFCLLDIYKLKSRNRIYVTQPKEGNDYFGTLILACFSLDM